MANTAKGGAEAERIDFRVQQQLVADHEEVKHYVLTKHLSRPRTNAVTMAVLLLLYIAVSGGISWALCEGLSFSVLAEAGICAAIFIGVLLASSRFLLIKAVECYQHYAKEETRRRCLCMPTCSEYAIAVLKRFPLPKALRMIRKRLYVTCRDGQYKKDFPF